MRRVDNLENDANMPAGSALPEQVKSVLKNITHHDHYQVMINIDAKAGGAGWQMTTPRASSPTDFSPPSVSAIRLGTISYS